MPPGLSLAIGLGLLALCWGYAWHGLRWVSPATVEPARKLAPVDGLRGILALNLTA